MANETTEKGANLTGTGEFIFNPSVNITGRDINTSADELNLLDKEILPYILDTTEMPKEQIASAEKEFEMLHKDRPKPGEHNGKITVAHSYNQIGTKLTLGELAALQRNKMNVQKNKEASSIEKTNGNEQKERNNTNNFK